MIPYGRHEVTAEDMAAVLEVLRSDFLTQGPIVPRFETAVATHVGAEHSVASSNGTAALHLACLALGLKPGSLLWTSPITFVASANCGRYCGADIDFVDIDPETWNLSATRLRDKLYEAKQDHRLPDVVVSVHLAGQPPDQEEIRELGREFGFRIIEDASHALGASRHGELVGSCRWSDVTIFSFHPVKMITTGEGGMALTNDEKLAWRMRLLRTHGITRDPEHFTIADGGPGHYEQLELGWNYRLSDVHAALGLSQLSRLETIVERRNILARRYDHLLEGLPLTRPGVKAGNLSSFHIYVVRLDGSGVSQKQAVDELRESGIGATLHYPPVHLQPYYRNLGFGPGSFPEAEKFGGTAMTLPLFPSLTEEEQDQVVAVLARILGC